MKKLFCLMVALALALTCASGALATKAAPKIFACPKEITGDYWTFNGQGVEQAGKDLGVNVVWNGPTEADVQTQINMINDMLEAGAKGILLASSDAAAMEECVTNAVQAGAIVVTWDSDCAGPRTCMVNFADDYSLGCEIAESLIRQTGVVEGNVALLTGQSGASNHITRIQGIKDTLAQKYPGIKIVVEMDCDDSQDIALSNAQNILATYDDIIGFATVSGAEVPSAVQAVQQAIDHGLIEPGSCHVAGSMVPSSVYEYLKEGVVIKEVLSAHPLQLGYAAVWMTNYLIDNGGVMPEVGTVLKIGEDVFGEPLSLTVVNEHLCLTPLLTVTSETVDNYEF